jgi:hypothetical protein
MRAAIRPRTILHFAVMAGAFFVLFLIPQSAKASDEDEFMHQAPVAGAESGALKGSHRVADSVGSTLDRGPDGARALVESVDVTAKSPVDKVEETAGPVLEEVEETAGPVVQDVEETPDPLKEAIADVADEVEDAGESLLPPTGGQRVEKRPSVNPVGIDLGARLSRTGGPRRAGSARAEHPGGARRLPASSAGAGITTSLMSDLSLLNKPQSARSPELPVPSAASASSPLPGGSGVGFGPLQAPLVVILFVALLWALVSRRDWALVGANAPPLARPG